MYNIGMHITSWVIGGLFQPVSGVNRGNCVPEKTPLPFLYYVIISDLRNLATMMAQVAQRVFCNFKEVVAFSNNKVWRPLVAKFSLLPPDNEYVIWSLPGRLHSLFAKSMQLFSVFGGATDTRGA